MPTKPTPEGDRAFTPGSGGANADRDRDCDGDSDSDGDSNGASGCSILRTRTSWRRSSRMPPPRRDQNPSSRGSSRAAPGVRSS